MWAAVEAVMSNEHGGAVDPDEVTFPSGPFEIAAHLYGPASGDGPFPAVVVAGGFGGTKETNSPPIAQRYAQEGVVALALDHRGFGSSEGSPGFVDPQDRVIDVIAACSFLIGHDLVDGDRVTVHGSSFGAGIAVEAGIRDRRIRGVISSAGVLDGDHWLKSTRSHADWEAFLDELAADVVRVAEGQPSRQVAPQFLAPPDAESLRYYADNLDASDTPRSGQMTLSSVQYIRQFQPARHAAELSPTPLLCVGLPHDRRVPFSETVELFETATEPKQLLLLANTQHHDIYLDPALSRIMDTSFAWHRQLGIWNS